MFLLELVSGLDRALLQRIH
jgi:hypothetical protein